MDYRCKYCKFFEPDAVGDGGECRRYPPAKGDLMVGFPDVDGPSDWCGEYSPKNPPPVQWPGPTTGGKA